MSAQPTERERKRARDKAYYQANKSKKDAASRAWCICNREARSETLRRHRAKRRADPEWVARRRAADRARRSARKDYLRAQGRTPRARMLSAKRVQRWREKNPLRAKEAAAVNGAKTRARRVCHDPDFIDLYAAVARAKRIIRDRERNQQQGEKPC